MWFDVLRSAVGKILVSAGRFVSGAQGGNPGCREDDGPGAVNVSHIVPATISEKGRRMIVSREPITRLSAVPDPPLRGSVADRMRRAGRT